MGQPIKSPRDSPAITIRGNSIYSRNNSHSTVLPITASSPRYRPLHLSKFNKYWRWWNYVGVFILLLSIVEFTLFLVSSTLLSYAPEPIRFDVRNYPHLRYQHFDTNTTITLNPHTTVYHVTKEFGPATMGGMGMILTSMTQAQLNTGHIKPYIVMPFYAFLRKQEQYPISRVVDLATTVMNEQGQSVRVEFRVSQFDYDYHPIKNYRLLSDEEKELHAEIPLPSAKVYLIGNGKSDPFRKVFRASSSSHIYSSPIPMEWRDQYFDKAVASFLIWKATGKHEESLFAPLYDRRRVDIIHIHGATNAYIAHYLREFQNWGVSSPAIVYTMHDYLDELQYTNRIENVQKFWTKPASADGIYDSHDTLDPYTYQSKVFMSPLAIDAADVVTFVSYTLAQDMVEGRLDFYLKEVIMESLLKKAQNHRFFGISNAVDLENSINPFHHPSLVQNELNYPSHAKTLIQSESTAIQWMSSSEHSVISTKQKAKQFLVDQGILSPDDLDRPLVLFVGRFQYNKGLETFKEAAELMKQHDIKFAIVGQPNNFPLRELRKLYEQDKDHVLLIDRDDQQRKWLIYLRAASDYVYVPSLTESFGLVAVEGLLFGSPVISTGIGGMSEFLKDRRNHSILHSPESNAYLIHHGLAGAIEDVKKDYLALKQDPLLHEETCIRMMRHAYALGWDRGLESGPVYDYLRIYSLAIQDKHESSSFKQPS
ncbi:hypothetical protein BDB01DRAFT_804773 [Pilobolus umbonatus]|nr:hypothetical protein BDB01DRAFT_804773 [Pilobolus umbonatus]